MEVRIVYACTVVPSGVKIGKIGGFFSLGKIGNLGSLGAGVVKPPSLSLKTLFKIYSRPYPNH